MMTNIDLLTYRETGYDRRDNFDRSGSFVKGDVYRSRGVLLLLVRLWKLKTDVQICIFICY